MTRRATTHTFAGVRHLLCQTRLVTSSLMESMKVKRSYSASVKSILEACKLTTHKQHVDVNTMDFTKTGLYQSLNELDDGTANAVFAEVVARDIDPNVLSILKERPCVGLARMMIKLIRACDYLDTSVPDEYTNALYTFVIKLTAQEITTLVDEYGENEIGLSISRFKHVTLPLEDNDELRRLKLKYARHVKLDWSETIPEFENVEDLIIDRRWEDFKVPERWINIRSIEFNGSEELVLPISFPKLEYIGGDFPDLVTKHDQPSLKELTVSDYRETQFPSLRKLHVCCGRCGTSKFTRVHPYLEVADVYHPKYTPNLKMLYCDPDNVEVPDHIIQPGPDDVVSGEWMGREIVRYFNCELELPYKATKRPLEFYLCYFDAKNEEVRRYLPNAKFVECSFDTSM